jgi:hypothetical protein
VATTAPDAAVSADIEVLIDSSPQGADVVVGKTVVGRTPFTGKLPSGEIAVVVRMRGYVSERRALAVVAGASLKVTLRKASGAAAGSGKGSNHDHDGLMRPDDL